jgi:nucleotide-binding universal stress UspA family protein
VVVNLMHPPSAWPLQKLGSGFNRLVQRSSRPILVLPGGCGSAMKHALLAYDGSAKAGEGLFIAAYLALRWHTRLSVITVETKNTTTDSVLIAQQYLAEYGVEADFYLRQGNIGQAVLETAVAQQCDLLIMGGFGFRPVTHLVLGSTVDRMLRECKRPMLICR